MSDTTDGLIGLLMLGGSFFFGKKLGEKKMINHYEDRNRDEQIRALQMEIEKLKKQGPNQIS